MSQFLMNKAWRADIWSTIHKQTLLALCDLANDAGLVLFSDDDLTERLGMDKSSLDLFLDMLTANGFYQKFDPVTTEDGVVFHFGKIILE